MTKAENIALHRNAYLEGRTEEFIRKFDEKPEQQQYSAVMAWKNRCEKKQGPAKHSPASICELLKEAHKILLSLQDLSRKDAERISSFALRISDDSINFEIIKKDRRLKQLNSERERLDKEIRELEQSLYDSSTQEPHELES